MSDANSVRRDGAGGLLVVSAGPQTLVEDGGRPGLAHLGVGASGAMDRAALALANRLVGNPDGHAALEVLLGGLALRASAPTWVAVTGAEGPVALDGRMLPPHTAARMEAGATLEFGPAARGIRYYLGVRGGVAATPVLGSRSRDQLAGLGPLPLADGDLLPIGPTPESPVPSVDVVPVDAPPDGEVTLGLRPGPRRSWFAETAWERLLATPFTVSARSDRTGVRLEGPALARRDDDSTELPSEGMVRGGVQVSPDGAPTVLGADHPVTGGYPVIAVVVDESIDALGQLRPGQLVRFRLVAGRQVG